jgi:hypothetical protein
VPDQGWIIGAYSPGIREDVTKAFGADHGPCGWLAVRRRGIRYQEWPCWVNEGVLILRNR